MRRAALALAVLLAGCATTQEQAVMRISERHGHDCMVSHDNYGKTMVGLWCPDRETKRDRVWYIYPDGTVESVR